MRTTDLATFRLLLTILAVFGALILQGQAFVHPGIELNRADLEFMKLQVAMGKQPWKDSFISDSTYGMKNIRFVNLTVRNFTRNGVIICGADDLEIAHCDFSDNGSGVIPGYRLHHNLLITHTVKVVIRDSRFDTSPHGCGIAIEKCNQIHIENNEIARNGWCGIRLAECAAVVISDNLVSSDSTIILDNTTIKNINE